MSPINDQQFLMIAVPVILILLIISGLIAFFIVLKIKNTAIKSKKWPSVEGVIEFSNWQTVGEPFDVKPWVRFKYSVNGKEYISNKLSLWWSSRRYLAGKNTMNKIQADYPVGKSVKVFYDPANPRMGILYTGLNTFSNASIYFWLVSSVIVIILSAVILFSMVVQYA